jgi:hypothetical protein
MMRTRSPGRPPRHNSATAEEHPNNDPSRWPRAAGYWRDALHFEYLSREQLRSYVARLERAELAAG